MRALTPKQARFVAEYLIDLNATQAAIRAGYSPRSAEVDGPRMLGNAGVAAAIAAGKARQLEKAELTAVQTLEAIRRQVCGDVRRLFDAQGQLKPIIALSAEEASLIAGFEVVIKNAAAGDGHTDTVHKIKLKDQARFVELAAKHFGLLVEKLEVQATTAAARVALLEAARRRVGDDPEGV